MPAPLDGLAAASALHWRGVDQQKIVIETGTVLRELPDQRLDRPGQTQSALVVGGPLGQVGKQVLADTFVGDGGAVKQGASRDISPARELGS